MLSLEEISDRLEIQQLLAAYASAVDAGGTAAGLLSAHRPHPLTATLLLFTHRIHSLPPYCD